MKKAAMSLLFCCLISFSSFCCAELDNLAAAPLLYHLQQETKDLHAQLGSDHKNETETDAIIFTNEETDNLWARTLNSVDDRQKGSVEESLILYKKGQGCQQEGNLEAAYSLMQEAAAKLQAIRDNSFSDMETPPTAVRAARLSKSVHSDLPKKVYKRIKLWLLPKSHALKPALDTIFQQQRVTQNALSLKEAGFSTLFKQKRSFILVAFHPKLPGHLLKVYLDTELRLKRGEPHWEWFARRCQGASQVRNAITRFKLTYFTVPNKFIYPLPKNPSPPLDALHDRKFCVLLVENMNLVSKEENLEAWKTKITKKHLNELYIIISFAKGSSYRADNIAYSKNGKFSFIDTEYPTGGPDFHNIVPYLSLEMKAYWDKLVRNGGPFFTIDI
jgi:hypothetical protein